VQYAANSVCVLLFMRISATGDAFMKIFAAIILLSSVAFAQSTSTQTPPSSTPAQTGTASAPAKATPTTPDRANAQTSVPADIKEVRRNLEALKTAVSKMDEGPEHDMAEQNVKFLESLVSYLEHENASRSGTNSRTPKSRSGQTNSGAPTGIAGENPK
jgi:TolA-binding protein